VKATERTIAPPLGNAIGLILSLWAVDHYDWLPAEQLEYIVIAVGTICIYCLNEVREVARWITKLIKSRKQ